MSQFQVNRTWVGDRVWSQSFTMLYNRHRRRPTLDCATPLISGVAQSSEGLRRCLIGKTLNTVCRDKNFI